MEDLITQLPNFAGLVLCIVVLIKLLSDSSARERYLMEVIVEKKNCKNVEEPPPADKKPAAQSS